MIPTPAQKPDFLDRHIPHRLCLLTTFRDRQAWFKERIGQADCDLVRVAKDSALISIRMFAQFLRITHSQQKRTDVFVDELGGRLAREPDELSPDDRAKIEGLHRRGNRELAHLTTDFQGHDSFNTARAIVDGINIIERLVRTCLYEEQCLPFPDLASEKELVFTGWIFVAGPVEKTEFSKS